MRNKGKIYRLLLILIFVILLISYIAKLNTHSIYIWDESIYANNSLEMSVTKNVSYYTNDYKKNYFNVKPPLIIIFQALSLGALGYSEFALRLPTLIFFIGVCYLLVYYSKKLLKQSTLGLEACIFLLLCVGVIRPHVFLSADLDAGVIFFSMLLFFNHLEVCEKMKLTTRNWIVYFFAFILGWLCKSTAIFLIVPALISVSIYYKNIGLFIKDRRAYFTMCLVLSVMTLYYTYKYTTDPYYVQLVWETEYMRLVKNIMPWHEQPFSFYFVNTIKHFALIHWVVLLITFILSLKRGKLSKIQNSLLLAIGVFLLTISIPTVKLEWYDAFIYPPLCLLLSITLYKLLEFNKIWVRFSINILLFLIMFIFLESKVQVLYSILQSQELEGDFFKNTKTKYPSLKVLKKVEEGKTEHYNVVKFYLKRNKLTYDTFNQRLISSVKDIRPLDTVLCCSQNQIDSLKSFHTIILLQRRDNCFVYKII